MTFEEKATLPKIAAPEDMALLAGLMAGIRRELAPLIDDEILLLFRQIETALRKRSAALLAQWASE